MTETVIIDLHGARPVSPNKQVWSRAGAMAAAKLRRGLRERAKLETMAAVSLGGRMAVHDGACRCEATLTRIAPKPFDGDNWQAAAKPARDGVADAFNLRDDAKQLSWQYDQQKGKPGYYGVRIELRFSPVADGKP